MNKIPEERKENMATTKKPVTEAIAEALGSEVSALIEEITPTEKPITDPRHLAYLAAVKEHAMDHYNDDGMSWDEIVEAWTDRQIVQEVWHCRSPQGAVNKIAKVVKTRGEYCDEIVSA